MQQMGIISCFKIKDVGLLVSSLYPAHFLASRLEENGENRKSKSIKNEQEAHKERETERDEAKSHAE